MFPYVLPFNKLDIPFKAFNNCKWIYVNTDRKTILACAVITSDVFKRSVKTTKYYREEYWGEVFKVLYFCSWVLIYSTWSFFAHTLSFFTLMHGSLEKLSVSAIWISADSSSPVKSFLTCQEIKGKGKWKNWSLLRREQMDCMALSWESTQIQYD